MPKITALIHTANDATTLSRTLESLRSCDELLVVDHSSTDDSPKIARDYGARVINAVVGVEPGAYATDARHDWILCMLPKETLSEEAEASIFEWKLRKDDDGELHRKSMFSFAVRGAMPDGWRERPPEGRLVDRSRVNWTTTLPPTTTDAQRLDGHVLRFED